MKSLAFIVLNFWSVFLLAQNSPFIHLDQFGYRPAMQKVAVLSDPVIGFNSDETYTPGAVLEVREAATDAIVFTAAPEIWNGGALHDQSGDRGWWFDFSELTDPGTYFIADPATGESSGLFEISESVYQPILKAAGRMFYYNRCNVEKLAANAGVWNDGISFSNPLQDGECRFIGDPTNASLQRDLSGGWFDAGDYNKYVPFTHSAVHLLLSAYEENPSAFGDDWNIPESGNGIPDLLDEVKWELDWLVKMVNSDGSVHIKMGSQNYEQNNASPPSANLDPRFYGATCTSASITVASVFAHAAKVYGAINGTESFAAALFGHAENCFAYAEPFVINGTLETECDDGSIVAGDADVDVAGQESRFLTAAIYLFEATGEALYQNYILDLVGSQEQIFDGFWGAYNLENTDALLLYAGLNTADSATGQSILESLELAVANDYNGFFGFSETDLFRAFMPEWSYHWGSNMPKALYGAFNRMLAVAGYGDPEMLHQYADETIHYFHGINPLGMVYLSNMYDFGAERSVNQIYHGWFQDGSDYDDALTSPIGPAPGYVPGGPNASFSYAALSPPAGQPLQKSYLDFNTDLPKQHGRFLNLPSIIRQPISGYWPMWLDRARF